MGNSIHLAAWRGDVLALQRLRQVDPTHNLFSVAGPFGAPVLHIAVYRNQKEFLAQVCSNLDYEGFFVQWQGTTALQLGRSLGNAEMVHFLMYCCEMSLEARYKMQLTEPMSRACGDRCALAYKNFRDGDGFRRVLASPVSRRGCTALRGCPDHFTPLFLAVVLGRVGLVQRFLDSGASPTAHPRLPEMGYRLLHAAARFDRHRVVPLLARAGCSLAATSTAGHTPLVVAAQWGHLRTIRAISRCPGFTLRDAGGSLALYVAAQNGHLHTLAALVHLGCSVDYFHGENTPLHAAAAHNHGAVVWRLLRLGACSSAVTPHRHYTPLHLAAIRGHCEVVEPLLATCCRQAIYAEGHLAPAELAVVGNDSCFLAALHRHGYDFTVVDGYGCSLLHYVVLVRHRQREPGGGGGGAVGVGLIDLLVQFGCDPHVCNDAGETPLDLAVQCGDLECVAVLNTATLGTATVSRCA